MSGTRDLPSLEDQLCFALYSASRAMTAAYRPGLDLVGLTYSQYAVMVLLWEHGSLTVHELCRRLQLDSATLSPMLQRMDGHGLVVRKRTPEDQRVVLVSLTSTGDELRDKAARVQAEVQERTGISNGELARLREELAGLTDRLRGLTR
ncbi:MAG: MarR family transcriptional regulator [Marmoricola sp.]|nr:MarR family transcriptional regulator [Marmoricola sp.]